MKHTSSWALRRVLKSLGRYLPLLLASLLLAAASVAGTLYIPILVGDAIDQIVGPGQVDFAAVSTLAVRIAVLAGLTAILQWVMTAIHNRVCFCVTRDVRRQAFSHLQRLPLAYLDSHPSGDTLSRMIADVDQFADGLLMGFTQLFTGVLTIVGTLGFMLSISWKITLVVVLLTPLSLLVAKFIAGHTYSMFQLQSKARGEQTALINEQLSGQRVVQAFSHEDESLRQFDEINDRLTAATMRATFFSSMTNPSTRIIYNIIYACVGFTGALSAVAGVITVGGLSCFLSYANQYAKPFNEITGVVTELQNALACAARVFELIDEPAETPDALDAKKLEAVSGSVELQNVAFSYTPEQHLIENLNLSVKPGQRIAIVGPTGCGKTTLIKLANGLLTPTSGEILIAGKAPCRATKAIVSYLPDRNTLPGWMTIAQALDYYGDFYSDFRRGVAEAMLMNLGLDRTQKIKTLSKGMREKTQLILTMSRDAKLYLLDEPIGGVDPATRDYILRTIIGNYSEDATVIISTHLIADVEQILDEVVFLREGQVMLHESVETIRDEKGKSVDELFREVFRC